MTINFYNRGSIDTISGGYRYNKEVINCMRSFGHKVEYIEEITRLNETGNNIIDSLVLKEALNYINLEKLNIGLIHQVDRSFDHYNRLKLIVTGDAAKNDLVENFAVDEKNIHVVKPGIDKNWKVKSVYKVRIVNLLCVSNYILGKGIDVLISTLGNLQDYDWNLKIVGNKGLDPQYYQSIERLVVDLGLEERIELISILSRSEINQLMIEADILVHFSENETYGMAIQEAIHTGLPVLMYKTGAWQEFKAYRMVNIIEDYSLPSFREALKRTFESENNQVELISAETSKRTWEMASREIESILYNN